MVGRTPLKTGVCFCRKGGSGEQIVEYFKKQDSTGSLRVLAQTNKGKTSDFNYLTAVMVFQSLGERMMALKFLNTNKPSKKLARVHASDKSFECIFDELQYVVCQK
jgi:hypothetical protein